MGSNQIGSRMEEKERIPASQNVSKQPSFFQKIADLYGRLGCWILQLMLFGSPLLFLYICTKPSLWIFVATYLLWMYYDRETLNTGGRRWKFLRKIRFWRYRRDFFPIKLVKTAELPPDSRYLFASFPHGIWVIGASTNFLSEVNNFSDKFPGLTPYMHMQHDVFHIPFARELLLLFGVSSVSSENIQHVLNGPPGNVSIITVGGYVEMMKSFPGTNRLVLKNRKGFVRMALKTGSSLVPVYTFGETDTYDQMSFNWYIRLQDKLHSTFRLGGLVIAKGPSKLSHLFGILPYQRPITTVVGSPIRVPKVENPSSELVDKFHKIFIHELTALFDKYKTEYDSRGEKAILSIE